MSHCWQAEAKDRPDFGEIADALGSMLEANVRQHYLDLNDPYQEMNQRILNNNDYLQMNSNGEEVNHDVAYLNMKTPGTPRPTSDPLVHYDNLNTESIRPVDGGTTVSREPMEVVPMIQLDSFHENRFDEYLNMNSSNGTVSYSPSSGEASSPPPYNLVMLKI